MTGHWQALLGTGGLGDEGGRLAAAHRVPLDAHRRAGVVGGLGDSGDPGVLLLHDVEAGRLGQHGVEHRQALTHGPQGHQRHCGSDVQQVREGLRRREVHHGTEQVAPHKGRHPGGLDGHEEGRRGVGDGVAQPMLAGELEQHQQIPQRNERPHRQTVTQHQSCVQLELLLDGVPPEPLEPPPPLLHEVNDAEGALLPHDALDPPEPHALAHRLEGKGRVLGDRPVAAVVPRHAPLDGHGADHKRAFHADEGFEGGEEESHFAVVVGDSEAVGHGQPWVDDDVLPVGNGAAAHSRRIGPDELFDARHTAVRQEGLLVQMHHNVPFRQWALVGLIGEVEGPRLPHSAAWGLIRVGHHDLIDRQAALGVVAPRTDTQLRQMAGQIQRPVGGDLVDEGHRGLFSQQRDVPLGHIGHKRWIGASSHHSVADLGPIALQMHSPRLAVLIGQGLGLSPPLEAPRVNHPQQQKDNERRQRNDPQDLHDGEEVLGVIEGRLHLGRGRRVVVIWDGRGDHWHGLCLAHPGGRPALALHNA
mmetsp:Transcript_13541/g.39044  ORF Transcript_13541/g.39044 Transcript_13541/m.39044 type:complete len:531 (-) Transcript_13541:376-1968(-)